MTPDPCTPVRGGASLRPASCDPVGASLRSASCDPVGTSLRPVSCDPVGARASSPHRAIPRGRGPPARIVRPRGGAGLRPASCNPAGARASGPHRAIPRGREPPARIVKHVACAPSPSRLLRERKSVGSRPSGHCHAIPTRFKPLSPQRTSLFAATDDLKTRYNVSHKDGNTSSNL
jgi:hypothetical protein